MIDRPAVQRLLDSCRDAWGVPGAQLSVHGPDGALDVAAGEATRGGDPVDPATAFPLGSLTKPFTATLVLMLVDDGDLDPDRPLGGLLTGRCAPDDAVTVRRLLSHTAGLASDVDEGTTDTRGRERWLSRHVGAAAVHPPGTVFSYSNVGYLLLGHLVERVTGMSWRESVTTMLLAPMGITPRFVCDPAPARREASGHTHRDGVAVPVGRQALAAVEEPAGGLALSAADLADLARLHLGAGPAGSLLGARTRAAMAADQTAPGAGPYGMADGWGLGWALYRAGAAVWLGHDGTADGGSCHLRFDPAGGTTVALTTNAGTGLPMWRDVAAGLRRAGVAVPQGPLADPVADAAPAAVPDGCLGTFVNGSNAIRVVAQAGGDPVVRVDGIAADAALVCDGDLCFRIRGAGSDTTVPGRFLRDPVTGDIDALQLAGRTARRDPDMTTTDGVRRT